LLALKLYANFLGYDQANARMGLGQFNRQ